jgi:hypothetical protein
MKNDEFVRWVLGILILACVVFSIFFFQQTYIAAQSAPKPTPTPLAADSGNIIVSSPHANDQVSDMFQVMGKARVFENVVSIKVVNRLTGRVYYNAQTTTASPDAGQYGEFTANVNLTDDGTLRPGDALTVEIFQASAKDGSQTDLVSIPVRFTPVLP